MSSWPPTSWRLPTSRRIGRTARDLSPATALDCVAGYMVGNDLSARDLRVRPDVATASLFRADWLRHKSFDGSAPMGPWITPAAYVDAPGDLGMKLWVNDELKQDSCSSRMIFTAAEQIAALSRGRTLHPGDLVMTGTPAGVGHGSGEYLATGDVVRSEIAELGQLSFTIS